MQLPLYCMIDNYNSLQAFALLISPELPAPPFDPRPLFAHATSVANKACFIAQDTSVGVRNI